MTRIDDMRSLLLTTDQLLAGGHTSQAISRGVKSGDLIRLRPGFYVEGAARELMRRDRHLLMIAGADRAGDSTVFSHWSAALVHGLPDWGLPLNKVAILSDSTSSRSRSSRLIRQEMSPLPDDDIVVIDGLKVTSPERTVVDISRTCDLASSVAVADAALFAGLVTSELIGSALDRATGRAGILRARHSLGLIDGASESVAETRSRLIFSAFGLPAPETQVDIFDEDGVFIGRVDFFWPEFGVIGECDGFGKYFDDADPMETRRRLAREKDRDAALMALGYRVLHWRWADLDNPARLAHRVRSVLLATAA